MGTTRRTATVVGFVDAAMLTGLGGEIGVARMVSCTGGIVGTVDAGEDMMRVCFLCTM